jgi:hypothetical protein
MLCAWDPWLIPSLIPCQIGTAWAQCYIYFDKYSEGHILESRKMMMHACHSAYKETGSWWGPQVAMPSAPRVDALLEYTRIAASTLQDIPYSKNVPFLGVVSQVTIQIIPMVQVSTTYIPDALILRKADRQGKSRSLCAYDGQDPPRPLRTDVSMLDLGVSDYCEIYG